MFKKIVNIILFLALLAGIIYLSAFSKAAQEKTFCKEVTIHIDYNESEALLSEDKIYEGIVKVFDSIKGKPYQSLDLRKIEVYLNELNAIKEAHIHTTHAGFVNIQITQKKPLLRIMLQNGSSYYLDEEGEIFNTMRKTSARVPIANGNIPKIFRSGDTLTTLVSKLYSFAKYINKDEFFSKQIEQIYVHDIHEFELIPKIGNHIIVFGDTNNFHDKFQKLKQFYKDGITRSDGWKKYKSVNLKYKDQVVCTKR